MRNETASDTRQIVAGDDIEEDAVTLHVENEKEAEDDDDDELTIVITDEDAP